MQQLSLNMSDSNGEGINEQFFNTAELQNRRRHRQQLCKQAGEWSSFATLDKSIGSLSTPLLQGKVSIMHLKVFKPSRYAST